MGKKNQEDFAKMLVEFETTLAKALNLSDPFGGNAGAAIVSSFRKAVEHAAAEKIRKATDDWEQWAWSSDMEHQVCGLRRAADLIDPKDEA